MAEEGSADALRGYRIAVPETRELELFAELLERRGARVWRCPLVSIVDAADPAPVLAWLEAFNAGACDDLILLTGEGLRRLLGALARHRPAWRASFIARLGEVRLIVRGPKPARELRALGLKPTLSADPATTEGVIALFTTEDLRGRRVGVQLYGEVPNARLIDFLHMAGAQTLPVAPYAYADAAADGQVIALIEALIAGDVDAVAFTSASQVDRLFAVATAAQRVDALQQALARCVLAAVGPVAAAALTRRGLAVQAQPQTRYFLKPLAQALADALAVRRPV